MNLYCYRHNSLKTVYNICCYSNAHQISLILLLYTLQNKKSSILLTSATWYII